MNFDPQLMRRRFHELRINRDELRAKSRPLRAERDRLEAEFQRAAARLDAQIRRTEEPLSQIKSEMALLSRALNGKTAIEGLH